MPRRQCLSSLAFVSTVPHDPASLVLRRPGDWRAIKKARSRLLIIYRALDLAHKAAAISKEAGASSRRGAAFRH